jgi:carbon-monoxide dehydrogenase large subunit
MGGARYRARGLYRVPGYDAAAVRMEPSGKALVYVSHTTQGQGHLTTFAQVAAQELGLRFEDVTVIEGDTALTPPGTGTFASRGMVTGGGAVLRASVQLREKIQQLAGHRLEANAGDIVLEGGFAHVVGVPELRVSIAELAREASGLEASDTYDPPVPAVSYAAHAACVAVDAATGFVTVERYVVVHDCGTIVNPLIVEGQTHGAVVHGIGTALWEHFRYDEEGQPLTTTLMDYTIPTMLDIPAIEIEHMETPCLDTAGGFKGVGESGVMGAVPAIANAVGDALSSFGVSVNRLPLKPEYLLMLIDEGKMK